MLNLYDREWRFFDLYGDEGIFSIETTSSSIDRNKLNRIDGSIPYVTRIDNNNGIASFYAEQNKYEKDEGNCITVGLDTQTAFYQPKPFYTSQNIQIFTSPYMSEAVANFFLAPLKKTLSIFNWGSNGATLMRLKRAKIMLPVTDAGEPDYQFMKDYVKEHQKILLEEYIAFAKKQFSGMTYKPVKKLDECTWEKFKIKDICVTEFKSGKVQVPTGANVSKEKLLDGVTPRITVTANNNGVCGCYNSFDKNYRKFNNIVSVSFLGNAFYHPYECTLDMKVHCLKLLDRDWNSHLALFFINEVINNTKNNNFGYQLSSTALPNLTILLPVTDTGNPDYDYMEQYMKNIMIAKTQGYLDFMKTQ